jgi:hypothetical protein
MAQSRTTDGYWATFDPDSPGCWEWPGTRNWYGYGQLQIDGRTLRAHRVSWERHVGPIPPGLFVLHRCDNPPCVRPDHLFLGTQADNMADKMRKGREAHAGPLTPLRGEQVGTSKLTQADVDAIRHRYTGRRGEQTALGREFGVSHRMIGYIVTGQSWAVTGGVDGDDPPR